MILRAIIVSALLAVSFAQVGCETTATKQGRELASQEVSRFTVDIPEGVSPQVVQNSIRLGLTQREWVVTEQGNAFRAELNHRNINGVLDIRVEGNQIVIEDHSTNSKGEPFVPIRWIKNLQKDFAVNMISLDAIAK